MVTSHQASFEGFKQSMGLYVSQMLDQYSEMSGEEIVQSMEHDWDEQMREIMIAVIFKLTCGKQNSGITEFIQLERDDGNGLVYVPVCSCEWNNLEQRFTKRKILNP